MAQFMGELHVTL